MVSFHSMYVTTNQHLNYYNNIVCTRVMYEYSYKKNIYNRYVEKG